MAVFDWLIGYCLALFDWLHPNVQYINFFNKLSTAPIKMNSPVTNLAQNLSELNTGR